jgi:hypothetical protein
VANVDEDSQDDGDDSEARNRQLYDKAGRSTGGKKGGKSITTGVSTTIPAKKKKNAGDSGL